MSQKQEKLRRRVDKHDQRLEDLEVCVTKIRADQLRAARAAEDIEHASQRRREASDRAHRAESRAEVWRAVAMIILIVSLATTVVLVVTAKATEPSASAEPSADTTASQPICYQPDDAQEDIPDADENALIEAALLAKAHVIEGVTVTHYCICRKCCGKAPDHPAYGVTASGRKATPGISVAVDPSIIPLGSDVLVDYGDGEIHYYRADDTGGAVKGSHIDLCMASHREAQDAGVQTATVYWVVPEEVG